MLQDAPAAAEWGVFGLQAGLDKIHRVANGSRQCATEAASQCISGDGRRNAIGSHAIPDRAICAQTDPAIEETPCNGRVQASVQG